MGCSNSSAHGKPRKIGGKDGNQNTNGKIDLDINSHQYSNTIISFRPDRDYQIQELLEITEYGDVHVGMHHEKKYKRCIRMFRKTDDMIQLHGDQEFAKQIGKFRKFVHPNIRTMHDLYEDENSYFAAYEHSTGKKIVEHITAFNNDLNESFVGNVAKQLISALMYTWEQKLTHRSLSLDHIQIDYKTAEDKPVIKIGGFADMTILGKSVNDSEQLDKLIYRAPETFDGKYTRRSDIYSVGIIMYILLCGKQPFSARDPKDLAKKIREVQVPFDDPIWEQVSRESKECLTKMLAKNPAERIRGEALLRHTFLKQADSRRFTKLISPKILRNMNSFHCQQKLRHAVKTFIAAQLIGKEEREQLTRDFTKMDANGDGVLTREELLEGYSTQFGKKMRTSSLNDLFDRIDDDKTGAIDIEEFINGALDKKETLNKDSIKQVFTQFDQDSSGSIGITEIKEILGQGNIADELLEEMLQATDLDGDGEIDYDEFLKMMGIEVD